MDTSLLSFAVLPLFLGCMYLGLAIGRTKEYRTDHFLVGLGLIVPILTLSSLVAGLVGHSFGVWFQWFDDWGTRWLVLPAWLLLGLLLGALFALNRRTTAVPLLTIRAIEDFEFAGRTYNKGDQVRNCYLDSARKAERAHKRINNNEVLMDIFSDSLFPVQKVIAGLGRISEERAMLMQTSPRTLKELSENLDLNPEQHRKLQTFFYDPTE